LMQIYQQALLNDPQVLQAKAQRDAQYAGIDETRANLLPTISGNIGFNKGWDDINTERSLSSSFGGFDGGISLNQVIYNHSAWVGLDIAEKTASRADAQYAGALQGLITRVANAYFNVLTAADTVDFTRAEKAAIERQLEQTKQRFAVGLSAITAVHEAQAKFDLATADEIRAENDLENKYEVLREITGIEYDSLQGLSAERFSPSAPQPSTSNEWQKIAEQSSLELLAARLGMEVAKETIGFYKSGHMPSITANAGYNAFKNQEAKRSVGGDFIDNWNQANVGITMSIPIFEGFKVTSQVKKAQFDYVNAAQQLEQSHRSVTKQVRSNLNNVKANISAIRAYEQSVISAESALKATQAGFEVGTRTIVDVLNRTRDLFNAKRQLSQSRYGYITAILSLKAAAGNLTEADVQQINAGLTETRTAE
uniref:outer membrane channel protein TolC n=1 Tax=Paraferrimonas sp. SM1919 TaxID=2662263 RepID=UPI0013D19A55